MYSRYLENSRTVREQKEKEKNSNVPSILENIEEKIKTIDNSIHER